MATYICKKCGYRTNQKGRYDSHLARKTPCAKRPCCDKCKMDFSSNSALKRHMTSLAHQNRIKIIPNNTLNINDIPKDKEAAKKFLDSKNIPYTCNDRDTINIHMNIDGVSRKIFSYTLQEDDDKSSINELKDAIKPAFEMVALSKQMNNPESDKVAIQKKMKVLNDQLGKNMLRTTLVKKILFLRDSGLLSNFIDDDFIDD